MRRRIQTRIFIFSFVGLLLSIITPRTELHAQITDPTSTEQGERGAPRVYKVDARSVGLGTANLADPSELSSININPATLSFVRDYQVIQLNSFHNWNNNLMLENITVPVLMGSRHSIAAQFGFHHGGWSQLNYLGSNRNPEPSLLMYQFDIAYSYSFDNVFSIGMLNNVTFAQNEIAQYWTNFTTLGLLYVPSRSISYGIAFRGLGRSVVYEFIEGESVLGSQNLRESLEIGATLKFPVDTDQTYLAVSFSNEKRFGEDGMWYKSGVEVYVLPAIALRGGLLFQPESNIYAPRMGIGISHGFTTISYAVSPSRKLYERYHQLGITIHLNKKGNP